MPGQLSDWTISSRWRLGIAGALAGVVVTWLGYVAYLLWAEPFLPAALSDLVFAIVPGPLQAYTIALLGTWAKVIGFYLFMLAQIAAFTWAGIRLEPIPLKAGPNPQIQRLSQSWLKMSIILGGLFLLLSFTGASNSWSWVAIVRATVGTGAFYTALLELFHHLIKSDYRPTASPNLERQPITRRDLLSALASAAGALLFWPLLARESATTSLTLNVAPQPAPNISLPSSDFDLIPGLPPRVTPTEQFYYVSKDLLPHQARDWGSLHVEGLVERPTAWSLVELQELPATETYVTLACVDYEPNDPATNDLVSTALWRGVSMKTLIETAGARPEATTVELYSTDAYATAIPLPLALQDGTLLAYLMNQQPLDARHGFPVRLIVPGLYGYKNIKYVNRIVLGRRDFLGYWERRGWAQQAPINTLSRIAIPSANAHLPAGQPVWIGGIAFAGASGISKVEGSVDDGQQWEPVKLEEPLSPYTWRRWLYQWTPAQVGTVVLQVRATDGSGMLQTAVETSAFPAGATGYHRVAVRVD